MMYKPVFVFLCCMVFLAASAQQYPRNYFRHPMNIPLQLVANFGEIRTNHWHMGLDIRTQQRVNLPVYAAADGYIARVGVEPGGFGQAIYIAHPNGYTTLYAHMNSFFPALADHVRKEQYTQQSWRVNLTLPASLFPVKKGDFIGLSGSTGASQGPHVHFEIRDTRTEKVLNPLLFGFPLPDAVPPTVSRLALYDRNRSTYTQSPQLIGLRRSGGSYVPAASELIRVGSNRISFAVGAVDRFTGTPNPNGIYSTEVRLDDRVVSGFVLDNIGYDETRYINAQLDFPYSARGGAALQHTAPLPGATGVAYRQAAGDGVIQLLDEAPHQVVITVADANGNESVIRLQVRYDPSLQKPYTPAAERFFPNHVNVFERPDFELFTSEWAIYDTLPLSYATTPVSTPGAVSAQHQFLSHHFPSHDSVTVRIRPERVLTAEERDRVVIRNVSGRRTFVQKARWQNGWLAGRFRQFGTYQAILDTEPPTVNAPATHLTRATRIVFVPKDNLNTIRSFRAELDGRWLRFTNDKGASWVYTFDAYFPPGTHELKVTVEDEAGNVTTRVWTVVR